MFALWFCYTRGPFSPSAAGGKLGLLFKFYQEKLFPQHTHTKRIAEQLNTGSGVHGYFVFCQRLGSQYLVKCEDAFIVRGG